MLGEEVEIIRSPFSAAKQPSEGKVLDIREIRYFASGELSFPAFKALGISREF
jgi:hypothetical protein